MPAPQSSASPNQCRDVPSGLRERNSPRSRMRTTRDSSCPREGSGIDSALSSRSTDTARIEATRMAPPAGNGLPWRYADWYALCGRFREWLCRTPQASALQYLPHLGPVPLGNPGEPEDLNVPVEGECRVDGFPL